MERILRFPGGSKRDPAIESWFDERPGHLARIAKRWFELMRACGDDVLELLHDGQPTACIGDAAFCYVDSFKAHVNVGFFLGALLPDLGGLLEGSGKFMRHVKIRPGTGIDEEALSDMIHAAYKDMKARNGAGASLKKD
ncbi:MAG: DUF1801 domain-containing protein [Acidobacteriota bacterium]|nr:MAG: DUF1801 domain-containing protein [Acidobacteriota bacterium]